jgi:hypothetical protein
MCLILDNLKEELLVDSNFLTKEEVSSFQSKITSFEFDKWRFSSRTSIDVSSNDNKALSKQINDSAQMSMRIDKDHPIFNDCVALLERFCLKNSISVTEILRIKANILFRSPPQAAGKWNNPHVNRNSYHKSFLYYVNDSDGDTYFFDKVWSDGDPGVLIHDDMLVINQISPEAGKAIMFDGTRYHASSSPINSDYRVVINIDFL